MFPALQVLVRNSFFVRCDVTSKKPMRAHAVRERIPAVQQYKIYGIRGLKSALLHLNVDQQLLRTNRENLCYIIECYMF